MMMSADVPEPLKLGSYVPEIVRASFLASVGDKSVVVRFDRAAMFRLVEDAGEDALALLLHLKRAKIRDVAQRLFDRGFYVQHDGDLEILITERDLD